MCSATQILVTQNGKKLSPKKYTWDEKAKIFITEEPDLVIDFCGTGADFKTSSYCIFKTGGHCKFATGVHCIFYTGSGCEFYTGSYCTFDTINDCYFETGAECIFKISNSCVISTKTNSVVIRRDYFEIIPVSNKKIKTNGFQLSGYKEVT